MGNIAIGALDASLRSEVIALGARIARKGAARNILGRDVSVVAGSAAKASAASRAATMATVGSAKSPAPWAAEILQLFSALGRKVRGQPQVALNREIGSAREDLVMGELRRLFPSRQGFHILRQPYLRDEEGLIAHDRATGEARRLDFAVYKNNRVVRALEVTSHTADKVGQMAKEARIRRRGGTFLKDMDSGDLIRVPVGLRTRVYRIG